MASEDPQNALASQFRRLVEARDKRDRDKLAAQKSEDEYREVEGEIFEAMIEGPITSTLRFDFGNELGTIAFTPRETTFGRIIDADAALEFFKERGEKDAMSSRKIEKKKLNGLVRELLEQGKTMPPGIDWYTNRGVTISRQS
jgi:hypothetical protein